MKNFTVAVSSFVFCFVLGILCLPVSAEQRAKSNGRDAEFGELTCQSLSLVSGDGKHSIKLSSWETGVGMWMTRKDSGENICLVSQMNQNPYVGILGNKDEGCPFALGKDEKGIPFIQLNNKVKYRWLKVEDLMAIPRGVVNKEPPEGD